MLARGSDVLTNVVRVPRGGGLGSRGARPARPGSSPGARWGLTPPSLGGLDGYAFSNPQPAEKMPRRRLENSDGKATAQDGD